ncbi:ATP-binding cassette permease mdl1 [Coemansia sp. RSA 2530]|nr:ATP-binding cassette permease mdl1 [Coemansia sp. RSA 2530]
MAANASASRPHSPPVSIATPLLSTPLLRAGNGRYYSSVPHDANHRPSSSLSEASSASVGNSPQQQRPVELGVDPEEAQSAKQIKTKQAWLRLLRLAKPEYKLLGGAVGLLFVSSTVTMAVPFSMGKIIDMVTNSGASIPFGLSLTQVFVGLGSVFVVGAIANAGRVMLIRTAGERMIARLRKSIFERIMHQDMGFFDRNRSGDLVSRLSTDTSIVSKSITNNVSDGLRASISAVAGLGMMLYVSPKLTGIMLGIVPPIAIWAVVYGRFIKRLSKQTQEAVGDLTKVSEERISNVRTVQAFSRQSQEVARYDVEVQRIFSLAKREAVASGLFFGGNGLAGNLAILAFLGFGGRMVMTGEISIGDMTSVMLYSAYVGSALSGLSSFYSEIMKGVGAGSRLFYLLDRTPAVDPNPHGTVISDFKGLIKFEDVDFRYPTRSNVPVFQCLNLEIVPGSHVAVAGPSGKGKSTITALLLRFYDPLGGRILVDGHDIRELNLDSWRSHIAMVPQEPVLFAGTIRDNLLYGNPMATDAELIEALAMADALYFVERFPAQMETYVGERGVSLSGGQKQRIAIARALLARPDILILDEATSALDGTREARVLESLGRISSPAAAAGSGLKRPTIITVAHRASTLKRSDVVFVLGECGSVVEVGPYDELLAKENGYFRHLMTAQAAEHEK